MQIIVEKIPTGLHVSFAGVVCELHDTSDQCLDKVHRYALSYGDYNKYCYQLIIDTCKGVTQFYNDVNSIFPIFNVRTSLLFDYSCSLVSLINLFASKKGQIRLSKDGEVIR